jgi:hypothetical protein
MSSKGHQIRVRIGSTPVRSTAGAGAERNRWLLPFTNKQHTGDNISAMVAEVLQFFEVVNR